MNGNTVTKLQGLGDLGLACALCLTAGQHGIVMADADEVDEVARSLATTCREELSLSTIVVQCGSGGGGGATALEHFRESILIDSPDPTGADDDRSTSHRSHASSRRGGDIDISLDERRVADVVVAKHLNLADRHVQVQALELVRTGRIYTRTAMHSTGKTFLLVAVINDNNDQAGGPAPVMSRHLNDLFAIAHRHDPVLGSDADTRSVRSKASSSIIINNNSRSSSLSLRSVPRDGPLRPASSLPQSGPLGPETLARCRELAAEVTVTAEVSAYLQNVVVAMRLHRYVAGGISALATRHLRAVSRALAVLHGLDYLTPAVVGLAVRKVYLHRLVLADETTERSLRWGSDAGAVRENMRGVTVEDAIETVLASVQQPT